MRKKSILRPAVLLCVLLHGSISFGQETPVETANWPGNQSLWQGFDKYDFQVDGRDAYVIVPDTPAVGKPWVWRAGSPVITTRSTRSWSSEDFTSGGSIPTECWGVLER